MEVTFHSSSITPKDDTKGVTVADVTAAVTDAQDAAEKQATNALERSVVDGLFSAISLALQGQDADAQPTITGQATVTGTLTKVYVDVTVVPSGTAQQAKLDASVAAAAAATASAAQPAGAEAAGASTIAP